MITLISLNNKVHTELKPHTCTIASVCFLIASVCSYFLLGATSPLTVATLLSLTVLFFVDGVRFCIDQGKEERRALRPPDAPRMASSAAVSPPDEVRHRVVILETWLKRPDTRTDTEWRGLIQQATVDSDIDGISCVHYRSCQIPELAKFCARYTCKKGYCILQNGQSLAVIYKRKDETYSFYIVEDHKVKYQQLKAVMESRMKSATSAS